MSTPKVSVVIPCYNVEKYLRQCLDSVVNQTLRDLEIICVNDGSKDSTLDIIKEYVAKDRRVSYIDKPNAGYGDSMNKGFAKATGEYIGIIESDDYAELDMFEKMYTCAKKHDLDVVKSGFFYYYSKGQERNVPNPIASTVTASRTFCPMTDFEAKMEMVEFFNIKPTIWSAIYRNDFIRNNNITFNNTPGASFQDTSFNFKVWVCAERVRLMRECFLHYRQDNESSSINNPGKVYCVCDEYDEIARFLNERPLDKAAIEPVVVRIKYDSYSWNYERLSEPLQAEFIQRFSEDFRKHLHDGMLRKDYFEWYKWRRVHQIMEDPARYHAIQLKVKAGELPEHYDWEVRDGNPASPANTEANQYKRDGGIIRGGMDCIRDHGFGYTVKYGCKKVFRRVKR